jgi:hypothetical protein
MDCLCIYFHVRVASSLAGGSSLYDCSLCAKCKQTVNKNTREHDHQSGLQFQEENVMQKCAAEVKQKQELQNMYQTHTSSSGEET